jgi:hypothetical protein
MVRRMSALSLALLVLAAPPKGAKDDAPDVPACEVDVKHLKPQFAPKLPKGFKLVATKREKQHLVQTLKTPDGYEVTLRYGGCERLGFRLDIKGGTLTPKTVGAELVAVSKRVLPALPMAPGAFVTPETFLKALDDSTISMLPAQLPCGDAACQLSLSAAEEKAKPSKKPGAEKEPAGVMSLSWEHGG